MQLPNVMMKIGRAGIGDAQRLDVLRIAYASEMGAPGDADPEFTERLLKDPDVMVWIASIDREFVGFAIVMELPDAIYRATYGMMDDLFVVQHARGRGVAKTLISTIVEYGRTRNWAHLRWLVPEDDAQATALYEKVAERVGLHSYIIRIDPERSV